MADEQPKEPAPPEPPASAQQEPAPVPYNRFKEVNDGYNQLKARLAEIETKQKADETNALAEQNKWKELYEGTQKDLLKEKANNLRLKVATSKGLPGELVDRLRGETEDELSKDADTLLALVKPANSKGVPPPTAGGQNVKFDYLTETDPAKIREQTRKGQQ